jgi:hypothetical protein
MVRAVTPAPSAGWAQQAAVTGSIDADVNGEPRSWVRIVPPSDRPRTHDGSVASLMDLSQGSLSENLDLSDEGGDARLGIDRLEPVEEGAYRLEGSFEATLPFRADVTSPPDPDDVVEIEGDVVVERLPEDATE